MTGQIVNDSSNSSNSANSSSASSTTSISTTIPTTFDIQELLLSSPRFRIKIKPNAKVSRTVQLERIRKFEELVKDYFVCHQSTQSGSEPSTNTRTYFVHPHCKLNYTECLNLFVRALETCRANASRKGFCFSLAKEWDRSETTPSLTNIRCPVMKCQAVTAKLLAAKSPLILEFKPKRTTTSKDGQIVTFDLFRSRVATFDTTFKDIFIKLDCPSDKPSVVRYTTRKELHLSEEAERQLFAQCLRTCNLYKGRCFEVRGVSASPKPASAPSISCGSSGGGMSGLLSALLSQ